MFQRHLAPISLPWNRDWVDFMAAVQTPLERTAPARRAAIQTRNERIAAGGDTSRLRFELMELTECR